MKFKTVEQYFKTLDEPVLGLMRQMQETIRKAAPDAEEVISYNMPAFRAIVRFRVEENKQK